MQDKVVRSNPIKPLLPIHDTRVKFDIDIAIKRSVLHVKVEALQVHVHTCYSPCCRGCLSYHDEEEGQNPSSMALGMPSMMPIGGGGGGDIVVLLADGGVVDLGWPQSAQQD